MPTLFCPKCGHPGLVFMRAASFGGSVYDCPGCKQITVLYSSERPKPEEPTADPSTPSSPEGLPEPAPKPEKKEPSAPKPASEGGLGEDEEEPKAPAAPKPKPSAPEPPPIDLSIAAACALGELDDDSESDDLTPKRGVGDASKKSGGMGSGGGGSTTGTWTGIDPDTATAESIKYSDGEYSKTQHDKMKLNVFYERLGSVMKDNQYDRYTDNLRRGKLTPRNLFKVMTGSDKVFSRKLERKNKKYAVLIVVDVSGSMNGPRIQLAAASTAALMRGLSRHHMRFAVISYNGYIRTHKKFNEPAFDDNKLAALEEQLCKYAKQGPGHGDNNDFMAVMKAEEMLATADPTERTITLVITDGGVYTRSPEVKNRFGEMVDPCSGFNPTTQQYELKTESARLAKTTHLITAGMFDEKIKQWWPNPHIINNLGKFTDVILEEFGKAVVRG